MIHFPYHRFSLGHTIRITGKIVIGVSLLLVIGLLIPQFVTAQSTSEVTEILSRFAEDYRNDPALTQPIDFGVRVDGKWWTIKTRPVTESSAARVTVRKGKPQEPTFFFFLDLATLRLIDSGLLNPRTALGKSRMSDTAPMDIDPTSPDVVWSSEFNAGVNTIANHFWNRGIPEFLQFDGAESRVLHGANAILLHYEEGFRSVWYQIEKGQHINKDDRDQINPFPSLFIFTKGKAKAKIDGVEMEIEGGKATMIPAGVSHEFWNPYGEPFEFVLIMYGEGA